MSEFKQLRLNFAKNTHGTTTQTLLLRLERFNAISTNNTENYQPSVINLSTYIRRNVPVCTHKLM